MELDLLWVVVEGPWHKIMEPKLQGDSTPQPDALPGTHLPKARVFVRGHEGMEKKTKTVAKRDSSKAAIGIRFSDPYEQSTRRC